MPTVAVLPPEDNTPPNWITVQNEEDEWDKIPWPSKTIPNKIYEIKRHKRTRRLECNCRAGTPFKRKCSHIRDYLRSVTLHQYDAQSGPQQTQIDAYRLIQPVLGPMQDKVVRVLEEQGPMCISEIADATGLTVQNVCARLMEVRKKDRVECSHKAKNPKTGITVMFWKAVY